MIIVSNSSCCKARLAQKTYIDVAGLKYSQFGDEHNNLPSAIDELGDWTIEGFSSEGFGTVLVTSAMG